MTVQRTERYVVENSQYSISEEAMVSIGIASSWKE